MNNTQAWPSIAWGRTEDVREGLIIGLLFLSECFVLELCSFQAVRKLWKMSGGLQLYALAIGYNLLNMLVITPIIYAVCIAPNLSPAQNPFSLRVVHIVLGTVVQSIGYYATHRAMHTPSLYWCHRFHHRFNRHICPVAANAVTPVEYMLAYALPFAAGAYLVRPDAATSHCFAWFTGLVNLTIHTPALEGATEKMLPGWLINTTFHFEHHRKLAMNYAAPTLNVDAAVRRSATLNGLLARVFGKAYQEKAT